ncbi:MULTISPECIES: hypothetical protein [Pseudomonas syringae group]|uniref:hypothetical protein n=1 Tax=Pseudomonas syringae group TaxID=136849 RepID=UPI001C57BA23|nr:MULTISPECIES: hypothetical protein [Pseudomonas syringae group]MDU8459824.1 hypothetical protein [Pseudomonas syringae group sp. J254-4]QXW43402.1 hypothetical protein KXJ79_16985 [Pseudomonas amygdali]
MKDSSQHYQFSAPRVPAASPIDGLMPVDSLNRPVSVEVGLWSKMRPGYDIQLNLDGHLVGERKILTHDNSPGDVIYLELDEKFLAEDRSYTLCFTTTNNINQTQEDSPFTSLIIDRTAPGAALLAPIIFHQVNFGEALKGMLPGYADMQAGDCIQTFCNNREGPVHVVEPENLATVPMQIIFSKAFLLGLDSQYVTINYQVIDRAGNVSLLSHSVTLSMQL